MSADFTPETSRLGNERSAIVRGARVHIQNHLLNGGSLTLLLRDEHPMLDGVPLSRLVRWMPGFGPKSATRLLLGFPHHQKLSTLSAAARTELTMRVAEFERARFKRVLKAETACRA